MELGGKSSAPAYVFPLSFYYRVADQIVKQARVHRAEGNAGDLYRLLTKYISLMVDFIPHHQEYSTYSSNKKLQHNKILHDVVEEHAAVKPCFAKRDNSSDQVKCYEDIGTENIRPTLMPTLTSDAVAICTALGTCFSLPITGGQDSDYNTRSVKQFPSCPIVSCIEPAPLVGHVSRVVVPDTRSGQLKPLGSEQCSSTSIHDVHISVGLMEEFMELARANTDNDLETCGVLGASLKNRTFYVTTLIVPKQESTSSSCQALNEEEIFAVQDELMLFPVGWIHTHPSQSCFMSSVDLHTQYSYQVMLPEAVAIVMAPKDASRSYGIFRLTDPGGTTILRQCKEKGFHTHQEPTDGNPIYEDCSNVYVNPNLRFEIIDLRCSS